MFTGIVQELGRVESWQPGSSGGRLTVVAPHAVADARQGDSIAVNGVCLTVADRTSDGFTADVMAETAAATTLAGLAAGKRVNVEPALRADDRLGGHIVQGHVDAVAPVIERREVDGWTVLRIALPAAIAPLVAQKGSIAVDGVSLTVSAVARDWFEVSLIPETLNSTTLGAVAAGDSVNLESDVLARHVARLAEAATWSTEELA